MQPYHVDASKSGTKNKKIEALYVRVRGDIQGGYLTYRCFIYIQGPRSYNMVIYFLGQFLKIVLCFDLFVYRRRTLFSSHRQLGTVRRSYHRHHITKHQRKVGWYLVLRHHSMLGQFILV